RAPARSPRTAAATRRRRSTDAPTAAGERSRAAFPSPCRRCPTRSSPRLAGCSPASPTARSGRAPIAATRGALALSTATCPPGSAPSGWPRSLRSTARRRGRRGVVTSTPLELAVLLGGVVAHDASEDVRWVLDSCARLREQTGGAFDERAAGRLDPSARVKGWAVERGAAILSRSGASGSSIRATAG